MARKYWSQGSVLGSDGFKWANGHAKLWAVNRNIIYRNAVWDTGDPVVYLSLLQDYQGWFHVVFRGTRSVETLLPGLDRAVSALDSSLPIEDIETLHDHIQASYSDAKVPAELIGVYGICSLLVAVLGVYAGLAYSVAERTREFALRVALGAERQRIFAMIVRESGKVAIGGVLVGAIGAFFAVRVMKSLLFGVSPFDPVSAAGAVLMLISAAAFAAWLPARRAASIEPMQALRAE